MKGKFPCLFSFYPSTEEKGKGTKQNGGKALPPSPLPRTKSLEGTGLKKGQKRGKKEIRFHSSSARPNYAGGGEERREREEERWGEGLESTKCIALFKVILREGERRDLDYFLALNGYQ